MASIVTAGVTEAAETGGRSARTLWVAYSWCPDAASGHGKRRPRWFSKTLCLVTFWQALVSAQRADPGLRIGLLVLADGTSEEEVAALRRTLGQLLARLPPAPGARLALDVVLLPCAANVGAARVALDTLSLLGRSAWPGLEAARARMTGVVVAANWSTTAPNQAVAPLAMACSEELPQPGK